eukprot:9370583-Alexandrium_andersonii.AAC.1
MSRHMVLVAQALISNNIQNLTGVCDYYQNSVICTAKSDNNTPADPSCESQPTGWANGRHGRTRSVTRLAKLQMQVGPWAPGPIGPRNLKLGNT